MLNEKRGMKNGLRRIQGCVGARGERSSPYWLTQISGCFQRYRGLSIVLPSATVLGGIEWDFSFFHCAQLEWNDPQQPVAGLNAHCLRGSPDITRNLGEPAPSTSSGLVFGLVN